MSKQPYVTGAALIAGLLVGGSAYSARHGIGQPPADAASAARQGITAQIPAVPHVRLAEWHAPRLPRAAAPSATVQPVAAAPVPVLQTMSSAPVTRTSPAASDDGEHEVGDD